MKERRAFLVYVDLDPVPGTMHSPDSACMTLENILLFTIPHYNPHVTHAPEDHQPVIQKGPNQDKE